MKVCNVIALLLCIFQLITSQSLNIGTVLFGKKDLDRNCWTKEQRILLNARQIFQDVLPDPERMDLTEEGAATTLLEYFQTCFKVICESGCKNTQHLMLFALSDVLGGYLRAYILPKTKEAYYAGQIKYSEASKLFQVYDNIKGILRTNGDGWLKPKRFSLSRNVKPITITNGYDSYKGYDSSCDQLYLIDETKNDHTETTTKATKDSSLLERFNERKMSMKLGNLFRFRRQSKRVSCKRSNLDPLDPFVNHSSRIEARRKRQDPATEQNNACKSTVSVPLPILDDPDRPQSIALPFKVKPLRSLHSPESVWILVRFYVTVTKCLVFKNQNKCDVLNFNRQFYTWMTNEVFPNLNKEEWYPAFGGVLRIAETIKNSHSGGGREVSGSQNGEFLFSKESLTKEPQDEKYNESQESERCSMDGSSYQNQTYLSVGIGIVVVVWILTFCYCFCCYRPSRKSVHENGKESDESLRKTNDFSNSFIFQCLVKFFKRNADEISSKKSAEESLKTKPDNNFVGKYENEDRSLIWDPETQIHHSVNRQPTILMPAQIAATNENFGLGSIWPFADYRHGDSVVKPQPERRRRLVNLKENTEKNHSEYKRRTTTCRTLWKRQFPPTKTSESYKDEPHNRTGGRPHGKTSSNNDSYSDVICNAVPDDRLLTISPRKSQSALDYPESYHYGCRTSPDSYSSSEESESDRGLSSYNESPRS